MKKDKIYTPDYLPEQDFDDKTPWMWSNEMLDSNISIRWEESATWSWTTAFVSGSVSAWSWDISIDVWFMPTAYVIQAWWIENASTASTSYSSYINGTLRGFYTRWTKTSDLGTRIICIYNNDESQSTRFNHKSYYTTWINLDFITNDLDIKYTLTAYA